MELLILLCNFATALATSLHSFHEIMYELSHVLDDAIIFFGWIAFAACVLLNLSAIQGDSHLPVFDD